MAIMFFVLIEPPYLHLLLQLVQKLSVGSQRRDAGRALGGEDGSGDVLQTLLQRDVRAAHKSNATLANHTYRATHQCAPIKGPYEITPPKKL